MTRFVVEETGFKEPETKIRLQVQHKYVPDWYIMSIIAWSSCFEKTFLKINRPIRY